jgi:hypothetical protein
MSTASVNGKPVERATVWIPKWGMGFVDVQVASGEGLSGSVTFEIGDASFACTVVAGDVYIERGWYRLVFGAGGWRKKIGPLSFRDGAGVKLSQVLRAAAAQAGETLGTFTDRRIGPAYASAEDAASEALDLLTHEAWYVDSSGVTQIGARPAGTYGGEYQIIDKRLDRGLVTIATEDLAALVPGVSIEGIVVASVRIELTPSSLRAHLLADRDGLGDRFAGALRRLVEWFTRETFYHGRYEYVVESTVSGYVDCRPARLSLGLPKLANVPMRAGSPGATGDPTAGSSCEIQFLDGDPTRPVCVGFAGASGDSYRPSTARVDATSLVELAGGAQFLALSNQVNARLTDIVTPLVSAIPVPNDGGAALQAALKAGLLAAGWLPAPTPVTPPTTAASKTKGT